MLKTITSALVLMLLVAVAQAHYLWIESESVGSARIYFGEFNEGVRENAGGRLDERSGLELRLARETPDAQTLAFTRTSDHFAAKPEQHGWLLVQDVTSEVKDWSSSDIGFVKPMFYARAAVGGELAPAAPALTLDIIPDAKNARALRVFFKNQPLPKAKVMVHAPNEWSKELEANEAGEVTVATPWPGRYVIEVIHKERERGAFEGKTYEAIRHRVTFSHVF